MKMRQTAALLIAVSAATGLSSFARELADTPYLNATNAPDAAVFLAPPPTAGSPLSKADDAIFEATRDKKDSQRWKVATSDAVQEPFDYFACALDAHLTPDLTPKLSRLIARMNTGLVSNRGKDFFKVQRQFVGKDEAICEADPQRVAQNYDYPSGHATRGWAIALILAELVPERATQLLARGRTFGESRVVCRVHSVSAIEAGFVAGSSVVAALHALPEFRADLDAVRGELAEVVAKAPKPDAIACQAEADALKEAPFDGKP